MNWHMAEKDTRDLVTAQGQNIVNQVHKSGVTRHMNCYHCKRQHDLATYVLIQGCQMPWLQ